MTAIHCSTVTDLGASSEIANFQVTSDASKTTIKGQSIFTTDGTDHYICKWNYRRVDPTNPVLAPC
jgi:hypothetical protein